MQQEQKSFQLVSDYKPDGDQPQAIKLLLDGLSRNEKYQALLGVTGSGKTFTMANVIEQHKKPTLVISHNKTLAAQLYEEFKELFPNNAVSYFVSYYDYYQPEAYIPQRDIYIEKDAARNDDLDRLRLATTTNLISRSDTIIVASVSCIFGLGSPEEYKRQVIRIDKGETLDRQDLLYKLNELQYTRNDIEFKRSTFRVRGDVVELFPAYDQFAYRIEFFGDEIDALQYIDPVSGELLAEEQTLYIYPAVHYVMPEDQRLIALENIKLELENQVKHLRHEGKLLEAQRLLARTKYDIEMIEEIGYCQGVENYSRHFDGRPPGSRPYTLLDYFPDDWLLLIDESHVTIPQMRAMYNGDQKRKQTLVEHGFRLPSALDNRPLKFVEIEEKWKNVVFVSATPADYELEKTQGVVVEQVIRPTGLVDPVIDVRPATGQVADLIEEIKICVTKSERALVNTLTKRMAEDLSVYLTEKNIRCRYLHSDIDTIDRVSILKELREGIFDVLVGVNLLREGLDLPEVAFVAIMDADKAGFLRSRTSMIQQIGRAARNVNSKVFLYADAMTPAMQETIDETERRREIQIAYNKEHNITPKTIVKAIRDGIELELRARKTAQDAVGIHDEDQYDREQLITMYEQQMFEAAEALEFEKAARLRDYLKEVKAAPAMSKINPATMNATAKPGTPGIKTKRKRKKKKTR